MYAYIKYDLNLTLNKLKIQIKHKKLYYVNFKYKQLHETRGVENVIGIRECF